VVSIARDDPSIGGGHVCWGSYDGFNSLAGAAAVFPAYTVTTMHLIPSQTGGQTDRQTDTDIVA